MRKDKKSSETVTGQWYPIPQGENIDDYAQLAPYNGAPGGADGKITSPWINMGEIDAYRGRTASNQTTFNVNSWMDHFVIPAAKSAVVGLLGGGFIASIAIAMDAPWPVVGKTFLVVFFGMSMTAAGWFFEAARWWLESITGRDLDGDHVRGKPRQAPVQPAPGESENITVRVYEQHPADGSGPGWVIFHDLPREPFIKFARAMVAGPTRTFSQAGWTGRGMFTRPKFEDMKGRLIAAGFAQERGNGANTGAEMTSRGVTVLQHFLEDIDGAPNSDQNDVEVSGNE